MFITIQKGWSGWIGRKPNNHLLFRKRSAIQIWSFQQTIASDTTSSFISTLKTICILCLLDQPAQENQSMWEINSTLIIITKLILSSQPHFLDKPTRTRCKGLSTVRSAQEEGKGFIGQKKEKVKLLFSSMIWICQQSNNLELNLQLSYWGNGWIMEVGMTLIRSSSKIYAGLTLWLRCYHQQEEEMLLRWGTLDTSIWYMLNHSTTIPCSKYLGQFWNGTL